MTALVWDDTGEKTYEYGIDRGVLYVNGIGTVWNGLVSVENSKNDQVSPVYIDGFKVRNLFSIGDFSATLKAYTYPDEFLPCEGIQRYQGMYVDEQPPQEFSLTYRTSIGDDVLGPGSGYKIHILYNLTAVADSTTYSTLSLSPEPLEFSWSLSSRPEEAVGYRPAAHFIIDSRLWDPDLLAAFEEILYGSPYSPPIIPSFDDLIQILDPLNQLIIVDRGNGEWDAIDMSGDNLSFYGPEIFELNAPTVVIVDAITFDVSTYTTTY